MTEDEINKLADEVLGAEVGDPDVERAWLERQRIELHRSMTEIQAAFRLHRFLRDEGKMQSIAADMKKCRDGLTYFEKRLAEL